MACNVWSATPDFRELFNTFFATQHSAFYTDFYSLSTAFRHFFGFLNIFLSFTLFFVYNFLEISDAGARLLAKAPFQPTYSAITSHKMLQTSQSAEESIYGRKNISRGNANQRRRQFFSQAFKKNNFRQRGSASARYSDFLSCQYGSAGTLFRRADSHFHTAKKRRDPTNNRNGRHSGIP